MSSAQTTGFVDANSAATSGGLGVAWTNPTNALASGGAVAQVNLSNTVGNLLSEVLLISDWGFNIPGNATIQGIRVGINRRVTLYTIGTTTNDVTVQLTSIPDLAASANKSFSAPFPDTLTYNYYGSSTDKWGLDYFVKPYMLNDPGMTLSFRCRINQGTAGTPYSSRAQVDHVQMQIWYLYEGVLFLATSVAGG